MKSIKRVNFEDCDPFSHLNNAIYLNYFLTAREEQLRSNEILNIFEGAAEIQAERNPDPKWNRQKEKPGEEDRFFV